MKYHGLNLLNNELLLFANDTTRDLSKPTAVGLLESHHHFPCYCLRATARTRSLWFVPSNAQRHSIEDNMDIVAGNNSGSCLSSELCYWTVILNALLPRLTVIGDDVRIDWSRSIVKDAVFLSCMNQYGLIQPTNSRLNRVIAPRKLTTLLTSWARTCIRMRSWEQIAALISAEDINITLEILNAWWLKKTNRIFSAKNSLGKGGH